MKLVAMFLGASDCFSLFLQCNIIGKDNLLKEACSLYIISLDRGSTVILFLSLFNHLLLCQLRLLNVAKLGSREGKELYFAQDVSYISWL